MPIHNQISSLLGLTKPSPLPPAVQVLWCRPVNSAHIPIWSEYTYLLFCNCFNISPTPASSLILQYFCVDKSQSVSYKTLKVYLAVIWLIHIENGLTDPTTDESFHLVCRGICWQQNTSERIRLPITINLLRIFKCQLRFSQMSLLE